VVSRRLVEERGWKSNSFAVLIRFTGSGVIQSVHGCAGRGYAALGALLLEHVDFGERIGS
jgi:hypothetical protein